MTNPHRITFIIRTTRSPINTHPHTTTPQTTIRHVTTASTTAADAIPASAAAAVRPVAIGTAAPVAHLRPAVGEHNGADAPAGHASAREGGGGKVNIIIASHSIVPGIPPHSPHSQPHTTCVACSFV